MIDPTSYTGICSTLRVAPKQMSICSSLTSTTRTEKIVRAQLLWHLAHAILELAEQRPKVRFLILLSELPAEGDEFLSRVQPLITGQRAWILADQAKAIPSSIETTLDLADYASRMIEARGKPLELARRNSSADSAILSEKRPPAQRGVSGTSTMVRYVKMRSVNSGTRSL